MLSMLSMLEIWKFSHIVRLLFLPTDLTFHDMRLESLVEVGRAHTGVNDCKNNQYNRDDRETGESFPDW